MEEGRRLDALRVAVIIVVDLWRNSLSRDGLFGVCGCCSHLFFVLGVKKQRQEMGENLGE